MIHHKQSDRVNIYTLFAGLPTFIYLLPISILQTVLFKPESLWEQITSYALSLMFLILAVTFSVCGYINKRYMGTLNYTYIQNGFPIRSRFNLPHEKLQSVIIQKSPIPLLFNAVRVQLNTPATKAKKGDAMFYLSSNRAAKLLKEIYTDIGFHLNTYHANNTRIFFMASIWSNPVSGILIIAPFVYNTGKVAGERLSTQIFEKFDLSAYLIYIGLPPTTAIIAYFLLVCYIISVIADFIRNANFTCSSYQNGILIKRGVVKRTFFMTNCKKLNAISINQSLVMLPTHLYSAYIHTVGSGKTKGDKSLLVAAENKDNLKKILLQLLDGLDLNYSYMIRPVKKALKSYILVPFLLLTADIALSLYMQVESLLGSLTFNLMIFTIPWLLIWCIFRVIAHNKSAVSFNGKFIYVRGYKRLTFTTTLIPINKVQLCITGSNIFQKISKTCNIRIYTFGEKRTYVEIKHISIENGMKLKQEINRVMSLQ